MSFAMSSHDVGSTKKPEGMNAVFLEAGAGSVSSESVHTGQSGFNAAQRERKCDAVVLLSDDEDQNKFGQALETFGQSSGSTASTVISPQAKASAPVASTLRGQQVQYQDLEIPQNDLIIRNGPNDKLGAGGSAVVWKGQVPKLWGDKDVAIKVFKRDTVDLKQIQKQFSKELFAACQTRNQSDYVVSYIGFCFEPAAIVMELISNCFDLRQRLKLASNPNDPSDQISMVDRLKVLLKIARGMQWVHEKGLIHKDLKPENILCSHNLDQVKVADFGISSTTSAACTTSTWETEHYSAPEQSLQTAVTQMVDVWSFGLMVVELLVFKDGQMLWGDAAHNKHMIYHRKQQYCGLYDTKAAKDSLETMIPCSKSLFMAKDDLEGLQKIADLALRSLHPDPSKRPPFKQCVDRIQDSLRAPNLELKVEWKRRHGDSSYLYRCLTRSDAVLCDSEGNVLGLKRVSCQADGSYLDEAWKHVQSANRDDKDHKSPFFSFSRNAKFCLYYALQQAEKRRIFDSIIIKIDLLKISGLKLSAESGKYDDTATCLDCTTDLRARTALGGSAITSTLNYSVSAQEILIKTGFIPVNAIESAHQVLLPSPAPSNRTLRDLWSNRQKLNDLKMRVNLVARKHCKNFNSENVSTREKDK